MMSDTEFAVHMEVVKFGKIKLVVNGKEAEFHVPEEGSGVIDLRTLKCHQWMEDEGCGPLFVWHKIIPASMTGTVDHHSATIYNRQLEEPDCGIPLHEIGTECAQSVDTVLILKENK